MRTHKDKAEVADYYTTDNQLPAITLCPTPVYAEEQIAHDGEQKRWSVLELHGSLIKQRFPIYRVDIFLLKHT